MERLMGWYRVGSSVAAVVALVGFNLVPLAGVLWWGWNLFSILALYWVENGIAGAYNVLKMLRAEGSNLPGMRMQLNGRPIDSVARGPLASFFLLHYGFFWLGHGLFVLVFLPLIGGMSFDFDFDPDGSLTPVVRAGGDGPEWSLVGLGAIGLFVLVFLPLIGGMSFGVDFDPHGSLTPFVRPGGDGPEWSLVGLGAIGLAISHGISFWTNYVGRGEYRATSPAQLMLAPYGRLVILHLTIVLGATVSFWLGSPIGSLVVLVALKTLLDLFFHLREHRRAVILG